MRSGTYYGEAVIQAPVARQTHAFVSRSTERKPMAVTHIVMDGASPEIRRLPIQEACLMTVSVNGGYERDLYPGDRINPIDTPVPQGSFSFFDMRQDARLRPTSKADDIQFFFPLTSLSAIAEESGRSRLEHLDMDAGHVGADPILENLANILMPSFERPEQASWLFIDQIMLAAAAHVVAKYGGVQAALKWKGGLAPWQERRATEMLAADLSGSTTLEDIAIACGVSARHFSRAFRQTTGMSPHRWLLSYRIDRSKELLANTAVPLGMIASQCGFADHSHFTKAFSQTVGVGPAEWRRRQMGDDALIKRIERDDD